MRIGVVNWTSRQVGGAERYLSRILPALSARGHELGMLVEMEEPHDREPIQIGAGKWLGVVGEVGIDRAVEELKSFAPDVVFTHITLDPEVEAATQRIAPAALFTHAYYGTCISGTKTRSFPSPRPCTRSFGPGCLANFYPRRCGGLNPLTMLADYRKQSARNALLDGYRTIITNSEHMRREFVRNGMPQGRVAALPLPVPVDGPESPSDRRVADRGDTREAQLLFVGRMDKLKGGMVALDSLTHVANSLDTAVRLVIVGDGPERDRWEAHAASLVSRSRRIFVDFTGWIPGAELSALYEAADVLLVPSLWPEPFGLVGLEAGVHGLPAVAFPVGGIPEWLEDGVNGHLSVGPDHDAGALAAAIAVALRDPEHLLALRRGAREVARRFSLDKHIAQLEEHLRLVAHPVTTPGARG